MPGSSVLHSDGAHAYPSIAKKFFPSLKTRRVPHSDMIFVKIVTPARLAGRKMSSSLAGTQAIDSTWRTLDAAVPKQLKTKKDHKMNPDVEKYTFVWLYRVNRRNVDFFFLGKVRRCQNI